MKKFTFLFLIFFTINAFSQTTVDYAQRVDNYYTTFTDGGSTFNQGDYQVGMWANLNGKQAVSWRKFRTDASGASTSDRSMQVGDQFVATLSATRAYGRIGFALLASPSSTASWADRENNYAISVNLDGPAYTGGDYGNWYIKYLSGSTSDASFGGDQSNYKDFTFTLTLTAKDRMNVTIDDGTTTSNFWDVELNTSDPITDYSIFLQDDWDGDNNSNSFWGLGAESTQHKLTNTGSVTIGNSNTSFTISTVIPNGLAANSSTVVSPNTFTKNGTGTLTLSGSNTFTGVSTVTHGQLDLNGDLLSSHLTVNGGAILGINGVPASINDVTIDVDGYAVVDGSKSLNVNGTFVTEGELVLEGNLLSGVLRVKGGGILGVNGVPATLNDVSIDVDGYAFVNAGKALTVNGAFTNNGTFTVKSDVNGTGSLLTNGTVSGSINFERYIGAWSENHGWHFVSSPVADQAISPEFVDINGTISSDVDFFRWGEPDEKWISIKADDNTYNWGPLSTNFSMDFNPGFGSGEGYLTAYSSNQTKSFWGVPNNADVSKSNLSNDDTGWHLLGNPFPCGVSWGTAEWGLNNIGGTAKVWNESNASYTDITTDGYIPPTQGFMLWASSTTNSLFIPESQRTWSPAVPYKQEEINKIKLTAYDPGGNTAQESIIKFNENASTGFDIEFDSYFLAGYAPQFYSVVNGNEAVSTNTLPEITEQLSIPFSFIKNSSTDFYIEVEGIDNIFPQTIVSLVDLKTNTTQNLSENPIYTFESSEGDDTERFLIQFGVLGIEDEVAENKLNFYIYNNTLNIINNDLQSGTIQIFDMLGQQVMEKKYSGHKNSINLNFPAAYYIVRIISGKNIVNGKIHIE